MRVIITGGNGFVGRHLQRELAAAWPAADIAVWDLPEVDITKPETYREKLIEAPPAWIVHLAALANVGASGAQRERYFAVNVEGTRQLLHHVRESAPASRALVVSSGDIYGLSEQAQSGEPVGELSLEECRPANPYAESKLKMEQMVASEFTDRVVRVRPFPHLGPGQRRGFVTADFAARIAAIEKSAARRGVLPVGTLTAKRDFTDVRDVVRAYRLLMEQAPVGDVFNVSSGQARSIQEVLDGLLALSDAAISPEEDPSRLRPVEVPVLVGDSSHLTQATGWQPAIPFAQSLREILEWWREQPLAG